MKKSNIFGLLAILGLSAMILASCGGGSGSGKKLATNELLGDLPNLVYQKAINDSIRDAKQHAEREKFKEDNSKNFDKSVGMKWKKMEEEFDAEQKAANDEVSAEAEKIKPSLVNKALPFEVEEGCGYEVSDLKIIDVDGNWYPSAKVEFEVKITDEKAVKIYQWGTLDFGFHLLDKDGNLLDKDHTTITMSQKNGTTAKGHFYLVHKRNARQMVDFAKIKFIKVK